MERDTEQLNLLAIFHYVVAGLAALFSSPLLYTALGVIFIIAARHGTAKTGIRSGQTLRQSSNTKMMRKQLGVGFLEHFEFNVSESGTQVLAVGRFQRHP